MNTGVAEKAAASMEETFTRVVQRHFSVDCLPGKDGGLLCRFSFSNARTMKQSGFSIRINKQELDNDGYIHALAEHAAATLVRNISR